MFFNHLEQAHIKYCLNSYDVIYYERKYRHRISSIRLERCSLPMLWMRGKACVYVYFLDFPVDSMPSVDVPQGV